MFASKFAQLYTHNTIWSQAHAMHLKHIITETVMFHVHRKFQIMYKCLHWRGKGAVLCAAAAVWAG